MLVVFDIWVYNLGVPGYLPEYDYDKQVWYRGTSESIPYYLQYCFEHSSSFEKYRKMCVSGMCAGVFVGVFDSTEGAMFCSIAAAFVALSFCIAFIKCPEWVIR